MKRCFLFCLVCVLFCLGVWRWLPLARAAMAPHGPAAADPSVVRRLGAPTVAILQGATRAETFRIGVTPGFGDPEPTQKIDDKAVSATGLPGDRAFASRTAAAILDPRLYGAAHDRCLFSPGIVLRLWQGHESVDCVLCFHCDDVLILTHDAQNRVIHSDFTSFLPQRSALLALAKQAFPADQEIQAIPSK
jgi:hypothetical protein